MNTDRQFWTCTKILKMLFLGRTVALGNSSEQNVFNFGGGCGSVGKAVASDSRGPWFEFSHWLNLYWTFTINCFEKTKIMKKEAEKWPLKEMFSISKWRFTQKKFYNVDPKEGGVTK